MAFNANQQGAFWDFVRSISDNANTQARQGEGVDHHSEAPPASASQPWAGFNFQDFARGFQHNGPPPPHPPPPPHGPSHGPPHPPPPHGLPGSHRGPPPPFENFENQGGFPGAYRFPFGFGDSRGHYGPPHRRGGPDRRRHHFEEYNDFSGEEGPEGHHHRGPGHHGRHGGHRRSHSRSRSRSRSVDRRSNNDNENEHERSGDEVVELAEGENATGSSREGGRRGCGPRRHHGDHHEPHARGHGHGHGRGGRGRHGHGRGGWGWRGPRHGPPPPFDMSGLMRALSSHPLAQAFTPYLPAGYQAAAARDVDETDNDETFSPPVDLFNTPSAYILHVSLPGAKKEDVGVNWDAEKGELNIAGVIYRQGGEELLQNLTQPERKVGVFERNIKLPPTDALGQREETEVDGDGITAKLEDGVLTVTVRKLEREWTDVKKVNIN